MSSEKAKDCLKRGNICLRLADPAGALAHFDEAIQFEPEFLSAHLNRAVALQHLGRFQDALKAYEQAIKYGPESDTVWYNLGSLLSQMGREEDALAAFDKAVKFNGLFKDAIFNRGSTWTKLGNFKQALKDFNRVLELDPHDAGAVDAKHQVETSMKSDQASLERVLNGGGATNIDLQTLSQVKTLVQAGRLAEAKTLLGRIASTLKKPDNITSEFEAHQLMEVCGALGLTLKKQRQYEMALPWFNTLCELAIKFAPDSVDTAWDYFHYAESLNEYANQLAEPARTNTRKQCTNLCDQAKMINNALVDPNSELAEKINLLSSRFF